MKTTTIMLIISSLACIIGAILLEMSVIAPGVTLLAMGGLAFLLSLCSLLAKQIYGY